MASTLTKGEYEHRPSSAGPEKTFMVVLHADLDLHGLVPPTVRFARSAAPLPGPH